MAIALIRSELALLRVYRMPRAAELRSIGHQLNREGGAQLMRETATQADGLTEHYGTILRVIDLYWRGIGSWQG